MATLSASAGTPQISSDSRSLAGERLHRILLGLATCAVVGLLVFLAINGFPYYTLRLEDRPFYPHHAQLRSSGTIGLRLAYFGMGMFIFLSLYPLRKRWRWLASIGSTRR